MAEAKNLAIQKKNLSLVRKKKRLAEGYEGVKPSKYSYNLPPRPQGEEFTLIKRGLADSMVKIFTAFVNPALLETVWKASCDARYSLFGVNEHDYPRR